MSYWYLSFADGDRFLGATVVEAVNATEALTMATLFGRNPGGEALIVIVPPDEENDADVVVMREGLVGRHTMRQLGAIALDEAPALLRREVERDAVFLSNQRH